MMPSYSLHEKPPRNQLRVLISVGSTSLVMLVTGASLLTIPWADRTSVRFANTIDIPISIQSLALVVTGIVGVLAVATRHWQPTLSITLMWCFLVLLTAIFGCVIVIAVHLGAVPLLLSLVLGVLLLLEMSFVLRIMLSRSKTPN